jgi:hypothetical protein
MARDEEFEAFQRRNHARRRFFRLVTVGVSLIGVALSVALFMTRFGRWLDDGAPPPPAIEVDVDAGGSARVHDCRDDLETCVRAASDREDQRPGGRRHRAVVRLAAGAPPEAVRAARGVLLAHGFTPVAP